MRERKRKDRKGDFVGLSKRVVFVDVDTVDRRSEGDENERGPTSHLGLFSMSTTAVWTVKRCRQKKRIFGTTSRLFFFFFFFLDEV